MIMVLIGAVAVAVTVTVLTESVAGRGSKTHGGGPCTKTETLS